MRKRPDKKYTWFWVGGALLLFTAIAVGLFSMHQTTTQPKPVTTSPYLSPSQFQYQEAKLDQLMRTRGIESAFSYTESEIATNPSFAKDCHPLLHELGHAAYAYYGGYQQAIKYQNDICDSGYTHGVLEQYLSKTDLQQALKTACSPSASVFDLWQCYHGLGHGIMLVSLENVQKSITTCDTLPTTFSQNACINGVLMQHFVVTDHDGYVPKVNPTSLLDCRVLAKAYKSDCYNYAPTAYLTIHAGQYRDALRWCSGAETQFVAVCVGGVGAQAMKENINNAGIAENVCESAAKQYANSCVSGAINMFMFFHASSYSAEPLCAAQFKNYAATCKLAITSEHDALDI